MIFENLIEFSKPPLNNLPIYKLIQWFFGWYLNTDRSLIKILFFKGYFIEFEPNYPFIFGIRGCESARNKKKSLIEDN